MIKKTDFSYSDLRTLLENTKYSDAFEKLGIYEKDLTDGCGFIDTMWETLGYKKRDLIDGRWKELIHPDDLDLVLMENEAVTSGETDTFYCEFRVVTKNRDCRWILNRGQVVERDEEGIPLRIIGINLDITSRRKYLEFLQKAKQEAEQKVQEAETLRTAGTVIASSLDLEEAVNLVLEQAHLVVPYEATAVFILEEDTLELIGFKSLLPFHPVPSGRYNLKDAVLHARVISGSSPVNLSGRYDLIPEFNYTTREEPYTWMGIPLHLRSEVVGIFTFISTSAFTSNHMRLAAALADHVSVALNNAKLHKGTLELATIDPLTNTCTRRWFFKQAELIFRQTLRKGHELAVLMIDLDHFKGINDTYGHTTGDSILYHVCRACMQSLRTTDIIGRYGGEEFSIILPESGTNEATLVAGRLKNDVENLMLPNIRENVTVSIGICVRQGHETLMEMIQEADNELYRAKQAGRNTACAAGKVLAFSEGAELNKDCKGEEEACKNKH